jgi:mono/diheme cytochrome c family protein
MSKSLAVRKLLFATSLLIAMILLPNQQSPASSLQSPISKPDSALGYETFIERCANCHGPAGQGDGELAANLPSPPRDYTDPEWRNTAVPSDLFTIISNGRIENGMPPFGAASSNPLSDAEIWQLVATVWSLGTTPATIEQGQALYEATCQECHGGDGAELATADLSSSDYWFTRSNETIFAALPEVAEHEYDLSQDDMAAAVEYARTFSYFYSDPFAPPEPIETAVILGTVFNGSSDNERLREGTAQLRAFTEDFQEQLSQTAVINTDGSFQFDLEQVPPNWIYLVSVEYGDLTFTSSANQLNRAQPELELPVIVYDKTTDPATIGIQQLHLILSFGEEMVEVSELYIVSNLSTAVFVGETGDPDDGTVNFVLPTGAQNVDFQRSFGNFSSFTPALEVIPTDTGWADTLPVQPGSNGLTLLISYQLPYRDGLTIAHPLLYDTNTATVIIPDVGVRLSGDAWAAQGAEQLPSGEFYSYVHPAVIAGEALTLQLDGRPSQIADAAGNIIQARNENNELIIGSTVLLLVLIAAGFTVRSWQNPPLSEDADALLQALADLDDAYEAEAINPRRYEQQREQIKAKLMQMWQTNP